MLAKSINTKAPKVRRHATAALEFAACAPLMFTILLGLFEIGRMTEVQNVVWNSAREGARDASVGQSNLLTVASNVQLYLQSAEPIAFGQGHSTTMKAPTISLPANTYGYMCWDNTANRELFTMTFTDITNPVADPTLMSQLDVYQIGIQYPYATIGWLPVAEITGISRLYVNVKWAAMVDSPFQIAPYLPAQ
jgi:Flp pilus assembly protein TadG